MIYILLTLFQKVQWGCDILGCLIHIYIFPFQWKCCSVIINCTRNLVISLLIYRSTTLITRIVHSSLERPTFLIYFVMYSEVYQQNCFLNWLTLCFRPMHVSGSCLQPGSRLEGQLWHRVCLWERYLWILPMHQYVCPFPIIQTSKIYLHLLRNVWLLFPNIEALWSNLTCISLLVRIS